VKTVKTVKTKKEVMKDKSKKTPVKNSGVFLVVYKINKPFSLHCLHSFHQSIFSGYFLKFFKIPFLRSSPGLHQVFTRSSPGLHVALTRGIKKYH
jgi:hypothetical protein